MNGGVDRPAISIEKIRTSNQRSLCETAIVGPGPVSGSLELDFAAALESSTVKIETNGIRYDQIPVIPPAISLDMAVLIAAVGVVDVTLLPE